MGDRLVGHAENELERLYSKLEDATEEFANMTDRAARARADFKLAWATAFLRAEGSMDLRRAEADAKTYSYLKEKEIAEAQEKSQRALLTTIGELMGAARTVMASSRV